MTDIEILSIIIGVIGGLFAIIFGVTNWKRTQKKDNEEDGKNGGIVLTELGYIKAGIDDLKTEQREQRNINTRLSERITAVEESTKQAHKRLDRVQEQMNHEHESR